MGMCKSSARLLVLQSLERDWYFDTCRIVKFVVLQIVLLVRHLNHAKSVEHVRQLHPLPSGHYGRHSEAGHYLVVQRVQQIPAASQKLDQSRARVERVAHVLCEADEGATKGVSNALWRA